MTRWQRPATFKRGRLISGMVVDVFSRTWDDWRLRCWGVVDWRVERMIRQPFTEMLWNDLEPR